MGWYMGEPGQGWPGQVAAPAGPCEGCGWRWARSCLITYWSHKSQGCFSTRHLDAFLFCQVPRQPQGTWGLTMGTGGVEQAWELLQLFRSHMGGREGGVGLGP